MITGFDTLQYSKKLRDVGFTEQQAEVQAEALAKIVDDRVKHDTSDLRRDLMKEIATSAVEFKADLKDFEYRLITKMGGFLVVGLILLVVLMEIFDL